MVIYIESILGHPRYCGYRNDGNAPLLATFEQYCQFYDPQNFHGSRDQRKDHFKECWKKYCKIETDKYNYYLNNPDSCKNYYGKYVSLVGRKFGNVSVIGIVDEASNLTLASLYFCKCKCGVITKKSTRILLNNTDVSCVKCSRKRSFGASFGTKKKLILKGDYERSIEKEIDYALDEYEIYNSTEGLVRVDVDTF